MSRPSRARGAPRSPRQRLQAGAVMVVAAAVSACSGSDFATPDPATKQGRRIGDLWSVLMIAAIVVGVVVALLITWSIVRYRQRDPADTTEPPQTHANIPWEVAYTTVPILVVAALFTLSFTVQRDVDRLSPNPDMTVEVTGFQWQWEFHYPADGITVLGTFDRQPVMVLPVGATVRLVLTSPDVHHSFYVPDFLFKRDVIVGHPNEVDLVVERAGVFQGACAEFCGLDHDRMRFSVRAVPPDEYRAWLAEQK